MKAILFAVVVSMFGGSLGGCSGPQKGPRAGAGDPAVFTVLHLAAAEISVAKPVDGSEQAATVGSVRDDMLRYFRMQEAAYQGSRLRADDMLDGVQSARSTAQLASSLMALSGEFKWGLPVLATPAKETEPQSPADTDKAATPPTPDAAEKAGETTKPAEEEEAAKQDKSADAKKDATTRSAAGRPTLTPAEIDTFAKALTDAVADSPFDRIDRAYGLLQQPAPQDAPGARPGQPGVLGLKDLKERLGRQSRDSHV